MSKCIDCLREMHAADATESLVCYECRKGKKDMGFARVRSLTSHNAEHAGRKARSTQVIGGSCEMNFTDCDKDMEEVQDNRA